MWKNKIENGTLKSETEIGSFGDLKVGIYHDDGSWLASVFDHKLLIQILRMQYLKSDNMEDAKSEVMDRIKEVLIDIKAGIDVRLREIEETIREC